MGSGEYKTLNTDIAVNYSYNNKQNTTNADQLQSLHCFVKVCLINQGSAVITCNFEFE